MQSIMLEFLKVTSGIYTPGELELRRKHGNNTKETFLDVDIKMKNNEFQIGRFNKRDSFPFSILRMPEKSSNIPSNIFYTSIGANCLGIARIAIACNNESSFLNFIYRLVRRVISKEAKKCRIVNVLLKFPNKHQSDFSFVTKSREELLAII